MYVLRPPRSDDFEPLLALQTAAYRGWTEQTGGTWDGTRARRNLADAIARGLEVVEVDGRRVGALAVEWAADPVVLDGIEITAEHQGRGLGTRIVHDVLRRAAELGRAVELTVLRPNPARELYLRLGFRATEETATHVRMRWVADADGVAALARALAPWLDVERRDRWAARAFADPIAGEVGFLRFVARRHGLPEVPRVFAVDDASRERLRLLGAGEGEADLDLVLASDGALLEHCSHAERRAAAMAARERLRPGGIFVVDAPNMPWVLRHDPEPVPRTIVHYRALVSRITDRTFDFDAGVATLRDTFVAEIEDEEPVEWIRERRLALAGAPELRLALTDAGFVELETYTDHAATTPGRARGRRVLLVACTPPRAG